MDEPVVLASRASLAGFFLCVSVCDRSDCLLFTLVPL